MHNQEEGELGGEKDDFSASFRVDSPTMIPAAADRSLDRHDHSSTSSAHDAEEEEEEEEFEFSFLCRDSADAAAGAADEIFANGQIRPVYPLFDRKLLDDDHTHDSSSPPAEDGTKHVRLSLRKLFLDERSTSFSSSSSSSSSTSTSSEKDDELEGVPEGTYCVWTPKASAEQKHCKKSGSTGSTTTTTTSASSSSKLRLKIRDLVIGRSQSYGKEKFLFIPNNNKGKRTAAAGDGDGGNKKTFLPYKQDLVGLFSSVNAISRTHHPF
ncbi:uncharacterized protein M6B38_313860 [Iris pallida]|uniref:Uncharacterized protein n=1 Tax=Iris pallida TaxID=29817 RepID=A0AAX6HF43_IRIPA|nr:uncharacterized protein M6B38_313860 [Iris pallida]